MKFWQIVFLVVLVTLIGVGLSVWQPWKTASRTITVSGEGKIKSVPDVAKINGGVETRKAASAEAQSETSTKISQVIDLLKEKGIAKEDIKTSQISAYPNYNYTDGKNAIDGYVATTTIEVTIRDLSKGQEILDLMTANNITNLYGPNLTFSDEKLETLKKQAQEEAVKNAKVKAEELAKASEAKLGKVNTISETSVSGGTPIPYLTRSAAVDVAKVSSSTIEPGQDEITVSVSVSYSIK